MAARLALDRLHERGCRGKRVFASVHRGGARMCRLSREGELIPRLPRDRGNDADRQTPRFEHRALLDVDLAVAEKGASVTSILGKASRVAAKVADGLSHRHASSVG